MATGGMAATRQRRHCSDAGPPTQAAAEIRQHADAEVPQEKKGEEEEEEEAGNETKDTDQEVVLEAVVPDHAQHLPERAGYAQPPAAPS